MHSSDEQQAEGKEFSSHSGYVCDNSAKLLATPTVASFDDCEAECRKREQCHAFSRVQQELDGPDRYACNLYSKCNRLQRFNFPSESTHVTTNVCESGCDETTPYFLYKQEGLTCRPEARMYTVRVSPQPQTPWVVFKHCADACLAAKGYEYGQGCSAFVLDSSKRFCTLYSSCSSSDMVPAQDNVYRGAFRCTPPPPPPPPLVYQRRPAFLDHCLQPTSTQAGHPCKVPALGLAGTAWQSERPTLSMHQCISKPQFQCC